ncbi:metal-dependent hydrolase [Methanoregula formicica]|uniref:Putative membrane-bound metal-dependent hydrolase (DUF457) n=1 Tax=Methanoregula formicica (strain DSM 22288 / NBRC 105244 / SMSP) TaxID=593750 RepID=L0HFJ0_METFS|nr:metal-dependent hydrolase [Methanoregula formicica]AGB02083.1 putative membrane-bound metal-dependent hydrolase (DUF457) [Methanoregula formicica SMSP]
MFVFAHAFLGALIGLGFWKLAGDRRALPLCILSALLPDLLNKPLALLFPGLLGAGRTIAHSLFFFSLVLIAGLLVWQYRHTLLGMACACGILSHQVLDAMWSVPATWFFPICGPFPTFILPDYLGHYFWLEISSLSEWIFAFASLVILICWSMGKPEFPTPVMTKQRIAALQVFAALFLGIMGVYLIVFGPAAVPHAFFAPTYDPVTDIMVGIMALCGAVVLVKWPVSATVPE